MSDVRYELRDRTAWITIDRAERRNALSVGVCVALREALERAGDDRGVLAVVLTGAGDQAFCAGADLLSAGSGEGGGPFARLYEDLLRTIPRVGKPVIARVNGHALGGGLGLVLACDLAIAADTATLGTPEVRVGLFPMMVMSLLFRHVGRKRGLEMIFTGERVDAAEARTLGIVGQAVPAAELDAAVQALLARILDKSPSAIRLGRAAFYHTQDLPFDAALTHLRGQFEVNLTTEDAAEGIAAFLEKRPPKWTGR